MSWKLLHFEMMSHTFPILSAPWMGKSRTWITLKVLSLILRKKQVMLLSTLLQNYASIWVFQVKSLSVRIKKFSATCNFCTLMGIIKMWKTLGEWSKKFSRLAKAQQKRDQLQEEISTLRPSQAQAKQVSYSHLKETIVSLETCLMTYRRRHQQ